MCARAATAGGHWDIQAQPRELLQARLAPGGCRGSSRDWQNSRLVSTTQTEQQQKGGGAGDALGHAVDERECTLPLWGVGVRVRREHRVAADTVWALSAARQARRGGVLQGAGSCAQAATPHKPSLRSTQHLYICIRA